MTDDPGKVVPLGGETKGTLPVDRVLENNKSALAVVVVGIDEDGRLFVASSSADVVWMHFVMGRASLKILRGDFDTENPDGLECFPCDVPMPDRLIEREAEGAVVPLRKGDGEDGGEGGA